MDLISACTRGNLSEAKKSINEGADVNSPDSSGRTALIEAAWSGNTDIVKLLLEKGADINAADKSGFSALMRAAEEGHTAIVTLLIQNGADVNCRGHVRGTTPLMLAAENGHVKILETLLDNGAKVNIVDQYEETALARAYRTSQSKAAELLESRGGRGKPERSSYSHADRELRPITKASLPQWSAASQDIIEEEPSSEPDFDEE